MHDGEGATRSADEVLLGFLRGEVATLRLGEPIRADHGECDVMTHARRSAVGQQVERRAVEEVIRAPLVEVPRVGDVDEDLRPGEGLRETLARVGVDPGRAGRGDDVVAVGGEPGDESCAMSPVPPMTAMRMAAYFAGADRAASQSANVVVDSCASGPGTSSVPESRVPKYRASGSEMTVRVSPFAVSAMRTSSS